MYFQRPVADVGAVDGVEDGRGQETIIRPAAEQPEEVFLSARRGGVIGVFVALASARFLDDDGRLRFGGG